MRTTSWLFLGFVAGLPATLGIPFAGWLYGWPGAAVVMLICAVPVYFFGRGRRRNSEQPITSLWALVPAALPFVVGLVGVVHNPRDPASVAWLLGTMLLFVIGLVGFRTASQNAI